MAEQKRNDNQKKPRPKYNPNNKEHASKNKNKKKRWHKHHKKPVDMNTRLEQLAAYINGEFHQP